MEIDGDLGPRPLDARGETGLSQARQRVLDAVVDSDEALTATEVATILDLHPNTVREHLDALCESGLAEREAEPSAGRGRPAYRYAATPRPAVRMVEYETLAGVLVEHVAKTAADVEATADGIGRSWGTTLVRDADTASETGADGATARKDMVELLDELGFSPEADEEYRSIALRTCPVLDLAKEHEDVVCQIHHGLVSGLMNALSTDEHEIVLDAFSEPGACRLRVNPR